MAKVKHQKRIITVQITMERGNELDQWCESTGTTPAVLARTLLYEKLDKIKEGQK